MSPKDTLYKDGSWSLLMDNHPGCESKLKYWLTHICENWGQTRVYGQHTLSINRFWDNIDRPCLHCGSVCPAGLMGMYMMMALL